MNDVPPKGSDEQFDAIVAAYLERKDGPSPLDREELCQRHPEYAEQLSVFFGAYDKVAETAAYVGRNDPDFPFLVPVDDKRFRLHDYFVDRVNGVLGRGGMGIVYLAWDSAHSRPAAIKVMRPERHPCAADRNRFVREARNIAAIRHNNIVKIHHVDERTPYFVMEFVKGRTLQQRIDDPKPIELKEILQLGMQIANGLGAAHEQGLTHRDLKPSNILLENGIPHAKITDFGLARHAYEEHAIIETGVIAGTWPYMAPEQACGKETSHLSDLFSLGSCLFAMCTRQPPFQTRSEIQEYHDLKHIARIRKLNSGIPTWLTDVIAKLHAKNPGERFQTAEEVSNLFLKKLSEPQEDRKADSKYRGWVVAATILVAAAGLAAICEVLGITHLAPSHWTTHAPSPKVVEADAPDPRSSKTGSQDTSLHRPSVESQAFAILNHGQDERRFETLKDAIQKALSGDTIVVYGNGPYLCAPISIGSKPLSIRAAAGFQPVLELEPASTTKEKPLLDTDATLVLEGLTLRRVAESDEGKVDPKWYLVKSRYAPLYVANCRFELRPKMDCIHATDDAGDCEVVNCVFDSDSHAVSWGPATGSTLVLQNCLQSGRSAVHLHYKQADLRDATVRLLENSLSGTETIKLFVRVAPGEAEERQPFRFELRKNLIKSRDLVLEIKNMSGGPLPESGEPRDAASPLRLLVKCTDLQNRYAVGGRYLPGRDRRSLEKWNEFWRLSETGSEEVVDGTETPSPITARYLGPGEAYETWQSTPEFQVWQQRTQQALRQAN